MQHHGASLRQLVKDDDLVVRLQSDYRAVDLPDPDRAMLDYAAKLTKTPNSVTQADVDTLRKAGFSDAAVLDICLVASYFTFVNRIANGLGVELEAHWHPK